MKSILFSIKIAILSISLLCSLFAKIAAQDCRGFMPYKVGNEWTITTFDKKGLAETVIESRLAEMKNGQNGAVEAAIDQVIYDEKGKEQSNGTVKFTCKNGAISLDIRSLLPPESLGAYQKMEMTITGSPIEYPATMVAGQKLPDASMEMQVKSGSLVVMRMNFDMTNRLVVGREEVTTAAGVFNCFKMTYQVDSKIGFMKNSQTFTQWMAEGVGLVKSEWLDKKGKLEGSQQLTAFK